MARFTWTPDPLYKGRWTATQESIDEASGAHDDRKDPAAQGWLLHIIDRGENLFMFTATRTELAVPSEKPHWWSPSCSLKDVRSLLINGFEQCAKECERWFFDSVLGYDTCISLDADTDDEQGLTELDLDE